MNGYQQATALGTKRYNRDRMLAMCSEMICSFRLTEEDKSKMRGACCHLADALDRCSGSTLQQRWSEIGEFDAEALRFRPVQVMR